MIAMRTSTIVLIALAFMAAVQTESTALSALAYKDLKALDVMKVDSGI